MKRFREFLIGYFSPEKINFVQPRLILTARQQLQIGSAAQKEYKVRVSNQKA